MVVTNLSTWCQESQETALMMAAKKGSLEIVKKLIEHGAIVSLVNKVNRA